MEGVGGDEEAEEERRWPVENERSRAARELLEFISDRTYRYTGASQ